MVTTVYLGKRRQRLDPAALLGRGGEAEVYALGGGLALKVFKRPEHPDLAGDPALGEAARQRLAIHQRKLRAYPLPLPASVIQPLELAAERPGGLVVGYTMPLVERPSRCSDGATPRSTRRAWTPTPWWTSSAPCMPPWRRSTRPAWPSATSTASTCWWWARNPT